MTAPAKDQLLIALVKNVEWYGETPNEPVQETFRLIFNRYSRSLLISIIDIVRNHSVAEEVLQETFLRAYKERKKLREDMKLSTWLFNIAKECAKRQLRTLTPDEGQFLRHPPDKGNVQIDAKPTFELRDEGQTPSGVLLDKELGGIMQQALMKLDEDKRRVFTLKVLQQRSYEEIAEITGFSVGKLKTDLHRARAEMRKRIGPYLGRESDDTVVIPRAPMRKDILALSLEEREAITSGWDQTNARRVELIYKKIKKSITPAEGRELNNLQRLADKRIRLIAPLPIKELESLLENIKAEDK